MNINGPVLFFKSRGEGANVRTICIFTFIHGLNGSFYLMP